MSRWRGRGRESGHGPPAAPDCTANGSRSLTVSALPQPQRGPRRFDGQANALNIHQAIFAGHSVAGTELSKLGAAYPERVKKLVYLDAVDIGGGGWNKLPQPPGAPEMTDADLAAVQRLAAASAREDGHR